MKNKLYKNSFIYIFGDLLNKSVPFFMLPILTRYLTPEDYGIISIFSILVAIIAVFTGLSIHGAISVNFFKLPKNDLKKFIGSCIIILNISTIFVFIFVYLFAPFIIEQIKLDIEWLFIAVTLAFAQFFTIVNLLLWTAEEKPKEYSIYQLSQTVVTATLSLTLIVGFGMNWEGQLIALSMGTILFSIISFIFIIKRGYLLFTIEKEHIQDALKFGIPMMPHELSSWIKIGSDRILIMSLVGGYATGIYMAGFQLAMLINVLIISVNNAWRPYLFQALSNNPTIKKKKHLITITYVYFISILIFALIFAYLIEKAVPYILGSNFIEASEFVIYFAIAFAFKGMYIIVANYILYVKKTYILSYITLSTAVLHIGLLYFLIEKNGAIGAAQATLISYVITFLLTWFVSIRIYKMPWNLIKLFNDKR